MSAVASMTSRLTGLMELVSRTQDVDSLAFSPLTPPNPQSAALVHDAKLKKGHFEGVGLGVSLQAHLRESRAKPSEFECASRGSESDDERKRASLCVTVRKNGVDLPANIVRVLEHHRKKGIARQEAYLNESLLGAGQGGAAPRSSRVSRRKNSRRELSHSPSSGDGDDFSSRGRNDNRRMTASRLVADSIIVGAPKGAIASMNVRSGGDSPHKGASRLAVAAPGSAVCTFFSPEHFGAGAEPKAKSRHAAPPHLEVAGGERSASPNSPTPKDSPRKSPQANKLLKHFAKTVPNDGAKDGQQTTGKRAAGSQGCMTKKTMKTLKKVIGAKVNAQVRRMTVLVGQSDGEQAEQLLLDSQGVSPGSRPLSANSNSARFSVLHEEDEAPSTPSGKNLPDDHSDANTRSTTASPSPQGKMSVLGHMPPDLLIPVSGVMPEQISEKASPESPRHGSDVDKNSQGESPQISPKPPGTASSTATDEKKPMLFCGDRQPSKGKGGVRLTMTPVAFKTILARQVKKCSKPPPPLEPPPPAPSSRAAGEHSSVKKRLPSPARRPRRLSEADLQKVQLKLIGWTSQRDNGRHAASNLVRGDPGTMWESVGPADQCLTFDSGHDVEVCGLVLRCLGTKADPKDVMLLRSNSMDGPWIIVRRCFVAAGPLNRDKRKHQFLFEPGGPAQFWRLAIHQNWGAAQHVSIFAPLELLCRLSDHDNHDLECDLLPQGLQVSKIDEAGGRRSLTLLFHEFLNLTKEDREVRSIARSNGIPIDWAERVRDEFRKVSQGNELCFPDFAKIVTTLLVHGSDSAKSAAHKSDVAHIPEERIRHLWNEVDLQHSGQVDFEDFLIWFHSMFYCESAAACGQHSARQAALVNERFYASMGRDRLRQAVQKQQLRQRRLQDESA